jgi:hypothetical protein
VTLADDPWLLLQGHHLDRKPSQQAFLVLFHPNHITQTCTMQLILSTAAGCHLSVCCSIKAYHDKAVAAGIPALTTAGIYPGTSNVMAAHIVSISRGEYDENWNYKQPAPGASLSLQGIHGMSCLEWFERWSGVGWGVGA